MSCFSLWPSLRKGHRQLRCYIPDISIRGDIITGVIDVIANPDLHTVAVTIVREARLCHWTGNLDQTVGRVIRVGSDLVGLLLGNPIAVGIVVVADIVGSQEPISCVVVVARHPTIHNHA